MLVRRAIDKRRRNRGGHGAMFALALSIVAISPACGHDGRVGGPAPVSRRPETSRYDSVTFTDVEIVRDVQFEASPLLALDIYRPAGDRATKRPVVVWMHGGGFADGNRSEGPFIGFPRAFAELGYVAVSIDYRLVALQQCIDPLLESDLCREAAVAAADDARAAIRFLRDHAATYGLDPGRIAIAGESAGAIASTLVGLHADDDADRVQAWVSVSGGADERDPVDANASPGLLFSNREDPLVPFERSSATATAMQRAGVPVVLRPLEGVGHVPVDPFGQLMLDESRDFLYDHLHLDAADQ